MIRPVISHLNEVSESVSAVGVRGLNCNWWMGYSKLPIFEIIVIWSVKTHLNEVSAIGERQLIMIGFCWKWNKICVHKLFAALELVLCNNSHKRTWLSTCRVHFSKAFQKLTKLWKTGRFAVTLWYSFFKIVIYSSIESYPQVWKLQDGLFCMIGSQDSVVHSS